MTQYVPKFSRPARKPASRVAVAASALLTLALLVGLVPWLGGGQQPAVKIAVPDVPQKVDSWLLAQGSLLPQHEAAQKPAAPVIRKLSDSDLVAPKPLQECYGQADTIAQISWFEEKAAALLQGQELYFGPQRQQLEGTPIRYYLDDSIAVVTWKELVGITVLTFAEVKIADGSQFRRFLSDGRFGADTQYKTTEMAQTVNAVLASSGDFYKFHYNGVV